MIGLLPAAGLVHVTVTLPEPAVAEVTFGGDGGTAACAGAVGVTGDAETEAELPSGERARTA